jgi:hypothetical protein
MPTQSRWALPTLQLLNLFLKTDSNRIPYQIAQGIRLNAKCRGDSLARLYI